MQVLDYNAYADNVDGIFGAGDTPVEAKQSILDAIRLLKKYNKPHNIPAILKGDYELVYRALERLTGINQRQLQHYRSGLKKPRPAQKKKIETALHQLGSELMAIVL